MAEIKVINLLRKYRDWVLRKEIDFLKEAADRNVILKNVATLISDFEKADREAKKAQVAGKNVSLSDFLDWHETHEKGVILWRNLASYALKHIEPGSKGNSKLFDFLDAATDFEDLLYGLEPYYRDHTLHSLWVYFLGEHILRDHLPEVRQDIQWYLFNDIEDGKMIYNYSEKILEEANKRKKEILNEVDERKDAIWCIIALCHDLGYSLEKLEKLNQKVQAVLKFFDVPEFKRVGYTLDIEHQYLIEQLLQILSMDVRIVPSDNYKDENVELSEKVLVKCYRDDDMYWEFCRALEKKQHGILSAFLIFKVLSMFANVSVRGPAEVWGLEPYEARSNVIMGNILYAMSEHTLEFAYMRTLTSMTDILILSDELEEFSRLGRQLLSRKYFDTMAFCDFKFQKNSYTNKLRLDIIYKVAPHRSLGDFFVHKAEQLCRIYSLEEQEEQEELRRRWKIEGITITCKKGDKRVSFHLDENSHKTKGHMPKAKVLSRQRQAKQYTLFCDEDKLYVKIGQKKVLIRDWFKNLSHKNWKDDKFLGD